MPYPMLKLADFDQDLRKARRQNKSAGALLNAAKGFFSRKAVQHGLKPSFREMMRIRRDIPVFKDLPGGGYKILGDSKTWEGVRSAAPSWGPKGTLKKNLSGAYHPHSGMIHLAERSGRDTLRHELQHAYQFNMPKGGIASRMADWRSIRDPRSFKRALGDNFIELQANVVGHKSPVKGALSWGLKAPSYMLNAGVKGWGRLPYLASTAVPVGVGAAAPIAAVEGGIAAGRAVSNLTQSSSGIQSDPQAHIQLPKNQDSRQR